MAARVEHKVEVVDFPMARGGPFYELQVRLDLLHRDTLAAAPAGGDLAATCEAARRMARLPLSQESVLPAV